MEPLRTLFSHADYPEILSGLRESDDAAVYRISPEKHLVFTTDFFTPIVDDPYDYGAIAAANAMSDIYAMGGSVALALNIAGFPETMDEAIIRRILQGGGDKVKEAGAAIAGGHTVDSEEPFYGLAVVGLLRSERFLEKSGAQPGDSMIITKPLGSGIITTAFKGDACEPEHIKIATRWMKLLNRSAAQGALKFGCHAATDVTGFSLIGHALEIAQHSNVTLSFAWNQLPFMPGALDYAELYLFPAGAGRNQRAFEHRTVFNNAVNPEQQRLLFTPETSGGLLLCFAPGDADRYMNAMKQQNIETWRVGSVISGGPGIRVELSEHLQDQ